MQFTVFSFIMSLLCFNIYIMIINILRKKDSFIISFSSLPLIVFLFLSIFRLIFSFEIPGAIIIGSKNIYTKIYDFLSTPLKLKGFTIDVYQLLIFIWIIGIIILLINTSKKYILFKKNLDNLNKQQNMKTEQLLNKILIQNKVSSKIEVIQNSSISSPFILGVLKGKIYIPNIDFSEEELEYVISHEINHFLTNDSLKKILIQSIKYVFWWNPFIHLFASDFNQILEIQCDLKTTINFSKEKKIKYLESITKIVRYDIETSSKNVKYITAANFAEIKELDSLKQRFRIVLNYKSRMNKFKIFNITLYSLALFLFISSYFIIIQPHYEPTNNGIYEVKDDENSFIIEKQSGSYDVYIDNKFKYNIKVLENLDKYLKDLPIYKEAAD